MKLFVVLAVCFIHVHLSEEMSAAQLAKTGKLMMNVCVPKTKVAIEQVQNIKTGEFVDDQNVKCYIACVFQMANLIKNGKLNYEAAKKQIDLMFPEDMKAGAKKALDDCKHIPDKYKEVCEASFQAAKCMYKASPSNFVFP